MFALLSNNVSRNMCIRLTKYLQLEIYENLHSHLILLFLNLIRWGKKNRVGGGRFQFNEELINIRKLNYQNYMNSQIILLTWS